MLESRIEAELGAFEEGKISRRELVARLGAAAAAAWAAPAIAKAQGGESKPTFTSADLNHIALRVTDLDRSREFYAKHLGLELSSQSRSSVFMNCRDENFLAMFKSETPGLDHYCFGIDEFQIDDVVARLDEAGLEPRRRGNRVYFDDPDGIEVQLASTSHGA